jgi:uncharacterized small protein (DUF1192 family)
MAAIDDDALPKKRLAHEIGQDLALLSVEELQERITVLRAEIARLEEATANKRASLAAAATFFKK